MALSLTLPTNGTSADVTTVNVPFGQVQAAYNAHISGASDQHDAVAITSAGPTEVTSPTNTSANMGQRVDMIYVMLSAIMGGSGNASTRYGSLPTSITALNITVGSATSLAAGTTTLVKRDIKGGTTLGSGALSGATLGIIVPDVSTYGILIRGFLAGLFPFAIQNTAGSANVATIDTLGNAVIAGTLTVGSSSIVHTDAAGHILSTALNTVGVAQGGSGVATFAAGYIKSPGGTSALTSVAIPIPITDGGTGGTSQATAQTALGVPSTTGTGASGTWGIAISGNAGSATSAGSATLAATATTALGVSVGAVGTAGLADSAVTSIKIADGTVTGTDIAATTITAGNIANHTITATQIAGNTVGATELAAGAVGTAALANLSVTTGILADQAVTNGKIADYSIAMTKFLEGAILPTAGTPNLSVTINSLHKWNANGSGIFFIGGSVDLTAYVPTSSSQNVFVLIEINATNAIHVKGGTPTTSPLTDGDRPTADINTTPLGFVVLSTGQTQITAANIQPWIGLGGFPGAAISGGSPVGHDHGASSEHRIFYYGMDEGFALPTNTPSFSILINPLHYRLSSGIVQFKQQTTFGTFTAPLTGYRTYGVFLDPSSGNYAMTVASDSGTYPPAYPAFSGNQRSICYIHLTNLSASIKAGDDGAGGGWIEDARVWLAGSSPNTIPVGVTDGGTGQQAFAFSGLLMAGVGSTTAPFTEVPATTSATQGLAIAPTTTPGVSDSAQTVLGGGTVATGTSSLTNGLGVDLVVPTKTGTGVITRSSPIRATAGAIGTSNYAGIFIGGLAVTGVSAFPANPQTNETCYRNDFNGWWKWTGSVWLQMDCPAFASSFPASPVTGMQVYRQDTRCAYAWNGTVWQINGVEQTSLIGAFPNQVITTTTMTDVTSSTSTITTLGSGVIIGNATVRFISGASTVIVQAQLVVDGGVVSNLQTQFLNATSEASLPLTGRAVVAAGAHTCKLQASIETGTTMTVFTFGITWEAMRA